MIRCYAASVLAGDDERKIPDRLEADAGIRCPEPSDFTTLQIEASMGPRARKRYSSYVASD